MSRHFGIWIDPSHARIVDANDPFAPIRTIMRTPGRDQSRRSFHASIIEAIRGANEIILVGHFPACTALHHAIAGHSELAERVSAAIHTDRPLTDGELRAIVADQIGVPAR